MDEWKVVRELGIVLFHSTEYMNITQISLFHGPVTFLHLFLFS